LLTPFAGGDLDLDQEIWPPREVSVTVHCAALVQHDDNVRHTKVVFPVFPAVAHIDPWKDSPVRLPVKSFSQDQAEVAHHRLLSIRRRGREDVNAVPNLVVQIDAPPLTLPDQLVNHLGIKNESSHGALPSPCQPPASAESSSTRVPGDSTSARSVTNWRPSSDKR
jgi:hypothetical protein